MQDIFGLRMDTLMTYLVALFGAGAAVVGVLALRNRVVFKMGVRNVPRRRAQTALIVLGLMLATLLFSASFTTGDTLVNSNRLQRLGGLGEVDVQVRPVTPEANQTQELLGGGGGRTAYFDQSMATRIRQALGSDDEVAGVTPLAAEAAPVLAPRTGQSEPQASILGFDPATRQGFDPLSDASGGALDVGRLAAGEAYISDELASELGARQGEAVQVFLGERPTELSVAGIYKEGGVPGGETSVVLPLPRLQALTGNEGKISAVLITHEGGQVEGAEHTDATLKAVTPLLAGAGLEAAPVKRDALKRADDEGGQFTEFFTLFAGFSIAAGVLMIFLIFVMLAAERKRELGIARGVGMQRAHVVRMFTFEGAVYSLLSAAVGSLLGVAVGWIMVRVITAAFTGFGYDIVFASSWRSIVVAYTLGMVITFAVVVFSSWRASRLNVVRAIRDIPEPPGRRRGVRNLLTALALLAVGALSTYAGVENNTLALFLLGTSLLIIGVAMLARRFGLPDRAAYTTAGVLLLIWWLLPTDTFEALLPEKLDDDGGIEMFFLSGIMMVIAAVWTVVYNSDILLGAITAVFGRVKGLPPVLKTAVSYPMMNRFRTGMTLAMISLVMFTLVVMSFIIGSLGSIYSDTDRWGGGYDVRASVSYANPITDVNAALRGAEGVDERAFEAVATLGGAPTRVKQAGTTQQPGDLLIQGADDAFLGSVGYGFRTRGAGYATDRAVWRALKSEPNTAVVSALTVPVKQAFGGQQQAAFKFEPQGEGYTNFYLEEKTLPENLYIQAQDPQSGKQARLKVIGILDDVAIYTGDVVTSRATLEGLTGAPVAPQSLFFGLREGADAEAAARSLEKAFVANGVQATAIAQEIEEIASAQTMINTLLQGFMGLGLIVGVAALGVIAARAVVERRQQIGVLRAMGFQRSQVQLSFLLESSYVALLGIGIGLALGFGLSRVIIDGFAEALPGVRYVVPWVQLLVISGLAYAASLLTTFLPARQASRVTPAEALRFE